MRQSRYQIQKERERIRAAVDREKDTIYYLDFIPKDGQPTGRTTLLDDAWCVRLPRGRQNDPEMIEDAVQRFEQNHKVDSWREVASEYKIGSFYYP